MTADKWDISDFEKSFPEMISGRNWIYNIILVDFCESNYYPQMQMCVWSDFRASGSYKWMNPARYGNAYTRMRIKANEAYQSAYFHQPGNIYRVL